MKKQTFESEFLLSDEEILKLGVPNKDIETYRRKHYQDSFSIGSWYEKLNDHTFKTLSVPLYVKEAHALIELYRIKLLKNSTLSETSQEHLETLTKRLDEVLSKFQHGAFVKLNTRSPKDVPHSDYENPKYRKILDEELKKFKDLTPNNVIRAYFIAMNKSMRVTNGKEAVELLSKSYRVNEDLGKNTSYGDELYASGLEVREWIPEVADHPEMEFRCFVHSKKLNACSQYFCDLVFDDLIQQKKEIGKKILDFFDSVKDKIPHTHFVIDFFVGKDRVYIIELNPYHIGAGACLFSWKENRDLFMNGPFEFRINEKPFTKEDYQKTMSIGWEKYLAREHGLDIPGQEKIRKIPLKYNFGPVLVALFLASLYFLYIKLKK